MTRLRDTNKNGPRYNAPRARGHSSRLTRLSLAGLLLSRARLCFTEKRPLWGLDSDKQSLPRHQDLRWSKTVISASRVGGLKTVISALRLGDPNPTCKALAKPPSFRIIQRVPNSHATLSVFKRR